MTFVQAFKRKGEMIEFDIDFASGKLTGLHAERLGYWMDGYSGYIQFPQQQSFKMPHPAHNPKSMAWLLMSFDYEDIRGELSQYSPPNFSPVPDGAVS